jgi:chorismate--pyruvate lyase
VREVILLADGVPVVFAHSIVAPQDLCGPWRAVGKLGTRPLAEALFANPLVERSAIEWRRIDRMHHLHVRMARADLSPAPEHLARRSRFSLAGRPLIVTEVFLPEVLQLSAETIPLV